MENDKIIKEISRGIAFIGKNTYDNFITSWQYSPSDYRDVTKLETEIGALFLFDYMISAENVSQEFRQKIYTVCTDNIMHRYKDKVENKNLIDLIYHRYIRYAEIPAKSGDKWHQSFLNNLEINLKGTSGKNAMAETYPIKTADAITEMPLKMAFIRSEMGNAYRTAKIVEEVLNGRSLSESINTVQEIENSIKTSKEPKKKKGC